MSKLSHIRRLEGTFGDVWATAWGRDGRLYSVSDDTTGFGEVCNSNLAISILEADSWESLRGQTVNAMVEYGTRAEEGPDGATWKANGLTSIDGVLYLSVSRHRYGTWPYYVQDTWDASIVKSEDGGLTWSAAPTLGRPMFGGRSFSTPFFVQYGKDGADGADGGERWVYAVSNDGSWNNGTALRMGRVPRSDIGKLDGSAWEFAGHVDTAGNVSWVERPELGADIFRSPGRAGMAGIQYIPQSSLYLLAEWSYRQPDEPPVDWQTFVHQTPTVLEFYTGPRPWGPWRLFHAEEFAEGWYNPEVPLKFVTPSGDRCVVFVAGLGGGEYEWYGLNLLELDLPTRNDGDV